MESACAAIALADTAVNEKPVGSISPFWLPPTAASMPQSSNRNSSEPSDEMVSTSSSASDPAASIASRTDGMSSAMPVDVSLCTHSTPRAAGCAFSAAVIAPYSTPRRHPRWPRATGRRPNFSAMADQPSLNQPVSTTSTSSPGENRLTSVASHEPWPDAVYRNTSPVVRSTRFSPPTASSNTAPNSGSMKSMVGRSIARRMLSGMLVGPGLAKNWRPVLRGMGGSRACVPYVVPTAAGQAAEPLTPTRSSRAACW